MKKMTKKLTFFDDFTTNFSPKNILSFRFLGLNCGLAAGVHGESPCDFSHLELYLPRLGKVKMLTQYPQIVWGGGCLGVRR